ncbi:argininosuccinate lyase [Methanothermobacter wolfeii]|uniref:Argininosuccinate lyase n=1 Tax=Methanothermobacter wolfeii TaxID=145261 RepID=A0A9E7RW73_METWO|nr:MULTISPECIES: argininosuccinate lyase [Methanothermobacter]NLM02250.1 argininosuccinate lyase [Methanothermobacter wolfeii]QHN06182.1 argininosuccinate lyase [Methanothermobacter sp. THM-1]UXH32383.1 argininosuccinate lyase [Methanothermobacter wolfeii]SCM56756.1 Argininosuccinate lyase {ECO:0000255/HAMAP-Rule:MF_00006} [Methanothermobacter wolfeii]
MNLRAGRLGKGMEDEAADFTSSLEFDHHIFEADVDCNIAHTSMLAREGIIPHEVADKIIEALRELKEEGVEALDMDPSVEDIHMAVENYVTARIGPEAGFMHTGKSRNDQVATDLRLALKDSIQVISHELLDFIDKIADLASEHTETVMVGYTHLQHAQPTTLGHHLMAYAYSLKRDYERLQDTLKRVDMNPLGSAAMATTSFPINRELTTELLGFADYMRNSMDAVSSRDFIAEAVFDLSMLAVDLSRISEEMILWSTYEFGVIELPDEFSSTSSIMPQKKNPDVAEIARAKTSSVQGELMTIMGIMRALPYTYNRDLQEVTPHLWRAVETVKSMIRVVRGMLTGIRVNRERALELASSNFATATDLADLMVRERGIPFRVAHRIVGRLVTRALEDGLGPGDIDSGYVDEVSLEVTGDKLGLDDETVRKALDPLENVRARMVPGGPAPEMVRESVAEIKSFVRSEM